MAKLVDSRKGKQGYTIVRSCFWTDRDSGTGDSPTRAAVVVHSEQEEHEEHEDEQDQESQPSKHNSDTDANQSTAQTGADNPPFSLDNSVGYLKIFLPGCSN